MNTQQLADMIGVKYDTAVRLVARGEIPAGVRIIPGTHKVERVITEKTAKAFMADRYKHSRLSKPKALKLANQLIASNVDWNGILADVEWPKNESDAKMVRKIIEGIIQRICDRGPAG